MIKALIIDLYLVNSYDQLLQAPDYFKEYTVLFQDVI